MPLISIITDPGNRRVEISLDTLNQRIRTGIHQAFQETGKRMKQYARREIFDKSKKTGRVYFIRNRFGNIIRHQASAPGEYPANMTGALRDSIDFDVRGSDEMEFGSTMDRSELYPTFLENGTSRIEARPWLLPTVKKHESFLWHKIDKRISKELKRP